MMNRRQLLLSGAATLAASNILSASTATRQHFGWVKSPEARREFIRRNSTPYFEDHAKVILGTGEGKQVLLWKYYEKVTKRPFAPHFQEIGDCVGQAATLGAEVVSATQIAYLNRNEQWKGKFSTEVVYAGSRVEVGGGKIRRGDGSTGAWAVQWLRDFGVVLRGKYGHYDLTQYSPGLARDWGRPSAGVPDEIERIAKERPVRTVTLITSWKQACDAIANGYPVLLCSDIGFNQRTDADGFLRNTEEWPHAMLLFGIDSLSRRQGGCIANSWGVNWLTGPKHTLGTPAGCFWTDAEVIDRMLRQGDSYALSNFNGYPRRNLDYLLF